ncbi:hypothetical protein WG66_005891 [Moniliophthora roreri]|nr:hypothetical protein WG66_005891 [Moniliophthora roreri]
MNIDKDHTFLMWNRLLQDDRLMPAAGDILIKLRIWGTTYYDNEVRTAPAPASNTRLSSPSYPTSPRMPNSGGSLGESWCGAVNYKHLPSSSEFQVSNPALHQILRLAIPHHGEPRCYVLEHTVNECNGGSSPNLSLVITIHHTDLMEIASPAMNSRNRCCQLDGCHYNLYSWFVWTFSSDQVNSNTVVGILELDNGSLSPRSSTSWGVSMTDSKHPTPTWASDEGGGPSNKVPSPYIHVLRLTCMS